MQDPKLTVKDLLKDNWTAGNTSSITPNCHTGWFDEKSEYTQVSVNNPDEGEIGRGLKSNGSLVQHFDGVLMVNTWVTWDSADNVNPKKLGFEFTEEIRRIVKANRESATDLQSVLWLGRYEANDAEAKPTVYRYVNEVGYLYRESS